VISLKLAAIGQKAGRLADAGTEPGRFGRSHLSGRAENLCLDRPRDDRVIGQALPDHLPRETVEHDLSDDEKCCPECGEQRQRIGCERSEQLEFVPAVLKVLEHVR